MELSTKNQASLACFASITLFSLYQNAFTLGALFTCMALFGFVEHLSHERSDAAEKYRKELKALNERVDMIQLGQGMRR